MIKNGDLFSVFSYILNVKIKVSIEKRKLISYNIIVKLGLYARLLKMNILRRIEIYEIRYCRSA